MAVLLDQPFGVVACDEGADGVADLVDGLEDASVDGLLLQRAEEALDDAIRLGLSDEGVARRHAPEADLLLEVVGHEVAAVVMAQREAAGCTGAEMAEDLAHQRLLWWSLRPPELATSPGEGPSTTSPQRSSERVRTSRGRYNTASAR